MCQEPTEVALDSSQQTHVTTPAPFTDFVASDVAITDPDRLSDPLLSPLGQGSPLAALSTDCPDSAAPDGLAAIKKATPLTYSRRAKLLIVPPVLTSPRVQRPPRPPKSTPTPRRSQRLAAKAKLKKVAPEGHRLQLLLARKLGLSQDHNIALSKYKELFDSHLSREHIIALAALFEIPVPASLLSELSELPMAEVAEEQSAPL